MFLKMLATFFRKLGEAICSALRPELMLRIWLADHDLFSNCNGLLDLPLAVDLSPRGLSMLVLPIDGLVILLLDDIATPHSSSAVCCALMRLSVDSWEHASTCMAFTQFSHAFGIPC